MVVAAATARAVVRFPKEAAAPGEPAATAGAEGGRTNSGPLRAWATRAGASSLPDRLPALALLMTGLPLTWAGMRLLAGSGAAFGGVAVAAVGVGVIAWLSATCRSDAERRMADEVEPDGARTPSERLWAVVLPRAGGFRRGALIALPLAFAMFVWTDQRARGANVGHGDIVRLWLVGMVTALVAVAWPLRIPRFRDLRPKGWRGSAGCRSSEA